MDNLEKRWQALENAVINCRRCERLVAWREQVARTRRRAYREQEYWGRPLPGWGDRWAHLLIIGLAPAAHGGNRTGRVFTGDRSGDFLFRALYRAGFASQPTSTHRGDGLRLIDLFITPVCRCAPPANKPTPQEIDACQPYLLEEIELLDRVECVVALGKIAFDQILRAYRQKGYPLPRLDFGHRAAYPLGHGLPWLVASYHPSQQNTQTGRLTEAMFAEVWEKARSFLTDPPPLPPDL